MDKLVIDPDSDRRECVACGFSEARPSAPAPGELPTRVTRAGARRVETPAETIRLVDPASGREPAED
jgi:Zn ribbon nucleic-acid-binding protein